MLIFAIALYKTGHRRAGESVVFVVMVLPARTLLPPDAPIAFDVSEVDKSSVMAGGVTVANFPQASRDGPFAEHALQQR
jgi:hypothetical protein